MLIDTLQRLLVFIVILLAQGLVLNRIQLFGCAVPLLYVYFPIIFPRNYPKWASLLWAFALGLGVDMFANTPGLAAASTTLVAALQPYILELFLPREAEEHLRVGAATLGYGKYSSMTIILVAIFCIVFFALEAFSLGEWLHALICAGGSAVLTIILILSLESLRR